MNDTDAPTPNSTPSKRGRKPQTGSHRLLSEARKSLVLAQEQHEKALARFEREQKAESARNGRQIYLVAIERMHSAERALLVDPVLSELSENDRVAVQAWMDLLTAQKKCVPTQ